MVRDMRVEATKGEGGVTHVRVTVETTIRPIVHTAIGFVVAFGALVAVEVVTGEVPGYTFLLLLAIGLGGGYLQARALSHAKGMAGELHLDPEARRVEKVNGCASLPWQVLEVPRRALLVRRVWLSAPRGSFNSKPLPQHDLLLVPYRDRDHREKLVSDFAEWHRQESLHVYKGDDRPPPARDEQLVVSSLLAQTMPLLERLQSELAEWKNVRLFDLTA